MQTGLVESWNGNPAELGPLYPFVGAEMILFIVCFALWVTYTIWQMKFEAARYDEEAQVLAESHRPVDTIQEDRNI